MGKDIVVTYRIKSDNPREVAEAIRVEQSIEFPRELAEEWIQEEVVGSIESVGATENGLTDVVIAYDERNAGGQLPQLFNVLWGNVSMLPGIRVTDISLPDSLLANFRGPRFGIEGLRTMFNAPERALVSTALKPMGSSSRQFAEMARVIALAGFDTIKDDHSLANQPWSLWRERVEMVSEAVREANEITGHNCLYAPSMDLPADEMVDAAHEAKALGATSLLVLPGISGFDAMRALAEDDDLALPIMGHPAVLGTFVTPENFGLAHDIVFGLLMRLAGADISIFPNFGGRFSFTKEECAAITRSGREDLGNLKPLWVSPAGGMTVERIGEMLDFYGQDTASLVGGALHRGSLRENSEAMVRAIHDHVPS
jgi:ribulose-bisphosphate carboxylase large chain